MFPFYASNQNEYTKGLIAKFGMIRIEISHYDSKISVQKGQYFPQK